MTRAQIKQRFAFLVRVAQKEQEHLRYSEKKLFADCTSAEKLAEKLADAAFAETLEAYVSRFCRFQDTVGDKLLPAWLLLKGQQPQTVLDNLLVAEKLGLLDNAEQWIAIRQLRNQMVHEYIEDTFILYDALRQAHAYQQTIQSFAEALIASA